MNLIGILFRPNDESNEDLKKAFKNYIEFLYNFIPAISDIFTINVEDRYMAINCKKDLIEDNNLIECDKFLKMIDYLVKYTGLLKIYEKNYERTKDKSYKREVNCILAGIVRIFFELYPSFKNVAYIDEHNFNFKSIGDIIIMKDTDSCEDDDCEDDIEEPKVLLLNVIDIFLKEIKKLYIDDEDIDEEKLVKIYEFSNFGYIYFSSQSPKEVTIL